MSEIAYPVGNVTFVFTDIEGSTGMTEELEQTAHGIYEEKLRNPHRDRLLKYAMPNGHEIHRAGDGHLLVFQYAADALACVVKFQQSLRDAPILHTEGGKTYEIKVRVGVHTAFDQRRPERMENGLPEYPGSDTNKAARVGSLGVGGQIIVSQDTYTHARQLREYAASPCAVHAWPGRFLKGFTGAYNVYEILYFDSQKALEPGMSGFAEWYRSERNRFIDRPDAEARVSRAFERQGGGGGCLVTITGIGGTGKTRLAITCAARRADLYDDGVYFVSLATADLVDNPQAADANRNVAFVAQAIGAALKRTGEAAQPEPLFQWLRTKNLLLVLDNYESVHCDEVGEYLITLATEAAGVSLLITGRERVSGDDTEALVNLNGGMTEAEARDLFVARARLKEKLRGDLSREQQTQLHRILALTECIPLALELAVARIEDYSLQEIADSILATPLGDMGEAEGLRADDRIAFRRHRSLERSLTWSYKLLDATARQVLATASLFADTFHADTLLTVHGNSTDRRTVRALRNASLVYQRDDVETTDTYRFRLHRATREFAAQHLAELADADTIKGRFIAHYVSLVEENKDKLNDLSRHPLLDSEWRNVLAAADLAEAMQEPTSVMRLWQVGSFLNLRGLWYEWESICRKARDVARASNDRRNEGAILNNLGIVYEAQGRYDEAVTAYEQSLVIMREFKDRVGEGKTLNNLGGVYQLQGRYDEAVTAYERSLVIMREFKDRAGEGKTLNNLGGVYQLQGRYDEAVTAYEQSLVIMREFKDRAGEGVILNNLGIVYRSQGRYDEAVTAYEQSLVIKREFKDRAGEGNTLGNLGIVYRSQGRYDEAVTAYEQSLVIKREFKDRVGEGITLYNIALLCAAQTAWPQALAWARESVTALEMTQAYTDLEDSRNLVARLEHDSSSPG